MLWNTDAHNRSSSIPSATRAWWEQQAESLGLTQGCLLPPLRIAGICEKKNTEHRTQTTLHLIPMVYNDCNNQLFQSATIKITPPFRSAGTECSVFQVSLIAGWRLSPQRGNTGLFFLSIRTAESLFCCCYHFLLSNTRRQTEGLWGEVQAPSAFLLSCLETW